MANQWQQFDGLAWQNFSQAESAELESSFLAGKKIMPFHSNRIANFVNFKLFPLSQKNPDDFKALRRIDATGKVLNEGPAPAASSSAASSSEPATVSGGSDEGEWEDVRDEEVGEDNEEPDEKRAAAHRWWIRHHPQLRRPMWKPICAEGVDGPADASKFCGTPFISAQYPWPRCGDCDEPLQFFAQLAAWTLPNAPAFGDGLIQAFYCTDCSDYESFSQSQCMRFIPHAHVDLSQAIVPTADQAPADRLGPAQTVTEWRRGRDDFPNYEEAKNLGVDELPESVENIGPSPSDKIGGYPDWVQGVEYPNCPQCSQQMTIVLQIDSEDHVPFMWGDAGCAHLTQCPTHKEVLSLTWACH